MTYVIIFPTKFNPEKTATRLYVWIIRKSPLFSFYNTFGKNDTFLSFLKQHNNTVIRILLKNSAKLFFIEISMMHYISMG